MTRLILALQAFWDILTDVEAGAAWRRCRSEAEVAAPLPPGEGAGASAAIHTLSLLQREGRFIDFIQEDIAGYSDAQVGAAVRQIHAGCRKVLSEYFEVAPVCAEAEGTRIEVPPGFDPNRWRLSGRITGEPPFPGLVQHRGWQVSEVKLPTRTGKTDPTIITPAEIDVV